MSYLAHVINLSAKALPVSLNVIDVNRSDKTLLELDECSLELIPGTTTNDVACTIIKVTLSFHVT